MTLNVSASLLVKDAFDNALKSFAEKRLKSNPSGGPDINDGVRLNIRPFMTQDIPGGRKGAGVLRWKPNIKWNKDRGKEPYRPQEQYPWFWKDGEFTGDRVNDIHLSINDNSRVISFCNILKSLIAARSTRNSQG